MTVARIGPRHQITIPRETFEQLGLSPGDFLEVEVSEGALRLVPQRLIPRDQAWFWTPEWQAMEREADAAIGRGDVSDPFATAAELLADLHRDDPAGEPEIGEFVRTYNVEPTRGNPFWPKRGATPRAEPDSSSTRGEVGRPPRSRRRRTP